jgi:hypothetical protein
MGSEMQGSSERSSVCFHFSRVMSYVNLADPDMVCVDTLAVYAFGCLYVVCMWRYMCFSVDACAHMCFDLCACVYAFTCRGVYV